MSGGIGWRRREPRETRSGIEELFQNVPETTINFDPPFEGDPPTHVMTQVYRTGTGGESLIENTPLNVFVDQDSITKNGFLIKIQNNDGFPVGGFKLAWEAF